MGVSASTGVAASGGELPLAANFTSFIHFLPHFPTNLSHCHPPVSLYATECCETLKAARMLGRGRRAGAEARSCGFSMMP